MSTFTRSGHWRVSSLGNVHWVGEHDVSRDEWDRSGGLARPRIVTPGPIHWPTVYASFVVPNARCPVCGDPVFFYQSPYGGRVFFDDLGPPWPKHHCTDNGSVPTYLTQGNERKVWASGGWHPFVVDDIDWETNGAIVKGRQLGESGGSPMTFSAGVSDAEGIGDLVAIRWGPGEVATLSTVGRDGLLPAEFVVKRHFGSATIAEHERRSLGLLDAKFFREKVTADWEIVNPLKDRIYTEGAVGFRDGVPALAVFLPSDNDSKLREIVDGWIFDLVLSNGGDDVFSEAAWSWNRLVSPIVMVGSRGDLDWRSVASKIRGYGRSTVVTVQPFLVSSVSGTIRPLESIKASPPDGELQTHLLYLDGQLKLTDIHQMASRRRVGSLVTYFLEQVKAYGFRIDFRRKDHQIQLLRGQESIDLWLVYSSPFVGLIVTLAVPRGSFIWDRLADWPGEPVLPGGMGLFSDAPHNGRISRRFTTEESIMNFASMLGERPKGRAKKRIP